MRQELLEVVGREQIVDVRMLANVSGDIRAERHDA